jgi:hypothetical protein
MNAYTTTETPQALDLRLLTDAEFDQASGGWFAEYILAGPGLVVLGAAAVAGIGAAVAVTNVEHAIQNFMRAARGF